MVKKYYCDVCGKELGVHQFMRLQFFLVYYDKETHKPKQKALKNKMFNEDLCLECARKRSEELMNKIVEEYEREK